MVLITALSVPVFAAGELNSSVYSKETSATEDIYFTLTKPENKEDLTFKSSYVLCGKTELEGIRVHLLRYNDSDKLYEEFKNTDNTSSWKIGISGIFMKEVLLDKGINDLRLVAYKAGTVDGEDREYQITDFIITASDESLKEKIVNNTLKVLDMFKGLIK